MDIQNYDEKVMLSTITLSGSVISVGEDLSDSVNEAMTKSFNEFRDGLISQQFEIIRGDWFFKNIIAPDMNTGMRFEYSHTRGELSIPMMVFVVDTRSLQRSKLYAPDHLEGVVKSITGITYGDDGFPIMVLSYTHEIEDGDVMDFYYEK